MKIFIKMILPVFVLSCSSAEDSTSNTSSSVPVYHLKYEYEILQDATADTFFFPFKSCRLKKGAKIKIQHKPSPLKNEYKVNIVSIIDNNPSFESTENSVGSNETGEKSRLSKILDSIGNGPSEEGTSNVSRLDGESKNGKDAKFCDDQTTPFILRTTSKILKSAIDPEKNLAGERHEPSRADRGLEAPLPEPRGSGIGHTFPLTTRPSNDWFYGTGAFGASRSWGYRLHAGSDLYTPVNRPVLAVADGVVLDYYPFYSGTNAIVVKHYDGKVVRYGEVFSTYARIGSVVKKGQKIASVGRMYCCQPMLHFELYEGTLSGSLTQYGRGRYERRADLINPQYFLEQLYNKKFN